MQPYSLTPNVSQLCLEPTTRLFPLFQSAAILVILIDLNLTIRKLTRTSDVLSRTTLPKDETD